MKIVCFGDSLTACGGEGGRFSDILQDRFPAHRFVNRGVGGDDFVRGRGRFQRDVLAEHPHLVLVALGANDWWRDERPPVAWAADLDWMLARIRAAGAQAVVLGVFGDYLDNTGVRREKAYGFDARARAYRELERATAERYGCAYVANMQERIIGDRLCWSDSNHPNELGNRRVATVIEPILQAFLGDAAAPVRSRLPRTTRDMWEEAVALAPTRTAAFDGERSCRFAEADATAGRLAAGLVAETGVQRPKVAVYLPNCLEYFLLYWAVVRLGGVIVPLNTWLREDNLRSIFTTVQPDALVVRSHRDVEVLRAAEAAPPTLITSLGASAGLTPLSRLADGTATPPRPEIADTDTAIIMHTSGTTAAPKGAVMRHCDLMFNVVAAIAAHRFSARDVHVLVNPMFHCTALYTQLPLAAYQKTPVVITADPSADALMRLVARRRITTFLSVPAIFQRLVAMPRVTAFDASSLRLIAYAGAPMPVAVIEQLRYLFPGVELHNFFGLTETIAMTHVLSGEEAGERPDSIGRLLPFVDACVVDAEGQLAPASVVGELLFARDVVIPEYFNRPGKLEEAICELNGRQWFRTGDLAMVDDEGFFFIRGRQKDMIIVGGENVFAAEVEAVIHMDSRVREAAVKGIAATGVRQSLGEMIRAYVVPADATLTEQEVRRYCSRRLPSFKIPHEVVFLEALPRNPSGKVVKDRLV